MLALESQHSLRGQDPEPLTCSAPTLAEASTQSRGSVSTAASPQD
jgi:hypothetical protein